MWFKINSLRDRLLILFIALSFTLGLSITLYLGRVASQQMTETRG